jgi:hypothetical protein
MLAETQRNIQLLEKTLGVFPASRPQIGRRRSFWALRDARTPQGLRVPCEYLGDPNLENIERTQP